MKISPIELEIFKNLFAAICEEMGATLGRSAFSPNIKERKDYSCALFDSRGELVAQAAHIPVHLGSMPLSVKAALRALDFKPGDMAILNDPYQGGTHLPDITLVEPLFLRHGSRPDFFIANRAHHSDVGGQSPGSMPLASRLEDEGVVIPPTYYRRRGKENRRFLQDFLAQVRNPQAQQADLKAQESANLLGSLRLRELALHYGLNKIFAAMRAYRRYEARITQQAFAKIPRGHYIFEDFLDDDGLGGEKIPIRVAITVAKQHLLVNFSKSSPQVKGPLNATRAITLSAVAYVFRCLVKALTGEDCLALSEIKVVTRKGSLIDARYPAAVAGGNVETSQRIVDVLLGALAKALPQIIPAASQGTMNNIAMGNENFSYYETLGGGSGAGPAGPGSSAIHSHMTNTLNTPIEALESELPLRIRAYRIRDRSGGSGEFRGGDGLIREFEFLQPTQVSLLTERRILPPFGLKGGSPGLAGKNWFLKPAPPFIPPGLQLKLPAKIEIKMGAGDRLRLETPGGGGFKRPKARP